MHLADNEDDEKTVRFIQPQHWVSEHGDYLYNYALLRINDKERAKDIVQDVFLAAIERLPDFKGKSSERTWLTVILRNKIIDTYRKKGAINAIMIDVASAERDQQDFFDLETGHWNAAAEPHEFIDDHDPLDSKEFAAVMKFCLSKLPALWLSVFSMRHLDGETADSICNSLSVTPSNFWVILHRAKLNLRACIEKNWINL